MTGNISESVRRMSANSMPQWGEVMLLHPHYAPARCPISIKSNGDPLQGWHSSARCNPQHAQAVTPSHGVAQISRSLAGSCSAHHPDASHTSPATPGVHPAQNIAHVRFRIQGLNYFHCNYVNKQLFNVYEGGCENAMLLRSVIKVT